MINRCFTQAEVTFRTMLRNRWKKLVNDYIVTDEELNRPEYMEELLQF